MKTSQKKSQALQEESIPHIRDKICSWLKSLSFRKRRTVYKYLVESALDGGAVGDSLLNKMKHNDQVLGDNTDKITDEIIKKIDDMFSYSPRLGKKTIWSIYEEVFDGQYPKKLGQYFTPEHVANFVLTALSKEPDSILDPMAGHGVFLKLSRNKFPSSDITGVEIDPVLLSTSKLVLDEKINLVNDDVFEWAVRGVKGDPDFGFSAIVGNPAYVSYQNLQELSKFSNKNSQSSSSYRKSLLEKLRLIAEIKGVDSELSSLFERWSGYSDLSSYTLILSWLLANSNGQVLFVMTNHWMKRNYGLPIQQFLAARGDIKCIITHRKINWFPRAQIPTSIVAISKSEAPRKRSKNVLFIEITDSHTDTTNNLKSYLDSAVNQDFWDWVDALEKPGKYGPLNVSFLRWHRSKSRQGIVNRDFNLRLPSHLKGVSLAPLKEVGWDAHQGMRTGCNEVFYVFKDQKADSKNQYICRLTKNGNKQEIALEIPEDLLLPAIQKLPSNPPLKLNKEFANVYLLDLRNAILPDDKEEITQKYPPSWLDTWKLDKLKLIPENLANHLTQCGEMTYEKSDKENKVKDLTAIKPNIYKPKCEESDKIPKSPSFWYQLPLSPRHFGEIIIPRVTDGPLRAHLIKDKKSLITDANFVTFISQPESLSAKTLWIWLNSNTFRLICELNGVSMGGGALKVEATLVSKIPIPKKLLTEKDDFTLTNIEKMSKKSLENRKIIEIGKEIDSCLFNKKVSKENAQALCELIQQRQKKTSKKNLKKD